MIVRNPNYMLLSGCPTTTITGMDRFSQSGRESSGSKSLDSESESSRKIPSCVARDEFDVKRKSQAHTGPSALQRLNGSP